MGDTESCVGEWALDVANGLFLVFMANETTDLECVETGGVETGCGCGCVVVHVNKTKHVSDLSDKFCH